MLDPTHPRRRPVSVLAEPLPLLDVLDVEALVRKVADDRLRSWGARLTSTDHEDLVSYLIGTCWELSERYDPAKDKKPNFAAYASKILTLRCADWFRGRFGDTRHGERPVVLSLDAPGAQDGDDGGTGQRRLVDALASSAGDPAADRAPDLVGILTGRGGGTAGSLEALGEPARRRAPRGDRSPAALTKPRVPPLHRSRPHLPPPVCEACLATFTAAFGRVNQLRSATNRLPLEQVLEQAAERARAVKLDKEWVCPRCTTVERADGALLFLEQVYPNRQTRRDAPRQQRIVKRAKAKAKGKTSRTDKRRKP